MLVTMVVFGLSHGINVLNGQSAGRSAIQVLFTALLGGGYYIVFRTTGLLVVPMLLHTIWDFSLVTQATEAPRALPVLLSLMCNTVTAALVAVVLVRMARSDASDLPSRSTS